MAATPVSSDVAATPSNDLASVKLASTTKTTFIHDIRIVAVPDGAIKQIDAAELKSGKYDGKFVLFPNLATE